MTPVTKGQIYERILRLSDRNQFMIRKSVDVIRAAAAEQRGFADQVIDPPKMKARFLENAADLEHAANRLAELERWQLNLFQDACENALVEVSLLDAARQVIHTLSPGHPFLVAPMPSFGVWESQRKEIEALRAEAPYNEKIDLRDRAIYRLREKLGEAREVIDAGLKYGIIADGR